MAAARLRPSCRTAGRTQASAGAFLARALPLALRLPMDLSYPPRHVGWTPSLAAFVFKVQLGLVTNLQLWHLRHVEMIVLAPMWPLWHRRPRSLPARLA